MAAAITDLSRVIQSRWIVEAWDRIEQYSELNRVKIARFHIRSQMRKRKHVLTILKSAVYEKKREDM